MQKQIHYEVVQVVNRLEDGRMGEWFSGKKLPSEREAKSQAVVMTKSNPGKEFQVIRIEIVEIPRR